MSGTNGYGRPPLDCETDSCQCQLSVDTILHDDLKMRKETKRQLAQWKHTDSPPPKKFRVTAIAEKMMVAMFWDSEGMILTHCIPKSTTVTGETCEDVLLQTKLLLAFREKRPKKAAAVFFHHNNAPSHRAAHVH